MKQIITVDVQTRKAEFARCKTNMLVVGRFSDGGPDDLAEALDRALDGGIERLSKLGDFTGKAGTHAILYSGDAIGAERVMLVGLGEQKKATLDTIRKAAATAANKAVDMKIKRLSLALHRSFMGSQDAEAVGRVMIEGIHLGAFRYDEFITETKNGRLRALEAEIVDPEAGRIRDLKPGVEAGTILGRAQVYARTIANRPGNVINPPALAKEARSMARGLETLRCTIFDEKKLQANRMGGILAVGSGSETPPRLIVLKYTPPKRPAKGLPTVGLVGKAVTFDSGGISIKPSQDMDQMKLDKSGGIAVLATMKALAELELPVNVLGLIPSAENLPSGKSYRPGDIVTTYSGKTVEILNTDAEGRMIMCDAIAYAVKQKCDVVIDIATLTGACMVALGQHKAGLMSNDDDLLARLQKAAEDSGENVWHLPSGDEYADEMKSKIADLRNVSGRWGGASTAAAFLRQFAGEAKWAHLDIAGMDVSPKGTEQASQGGTGFGTRLLATFLMNLAQKK